MSALNVALGARLYRALADREEYRHEDRGERIDRTEQAITRGLSELDAELIGRATELDRMCGYAVRVLRKRAQADLLDLLGALPPDNLAAVAFALPEKRRRAIEGRDPYWMRAVAAVDPDALGQANEVADRFDAMCQRMDDGFRATLGQDFIDELARLREGERRIMAGLPHDLSLDELIKLYKVRYEEDDGPKLAAVT